MTRAAKDLYITQPSVSQAITELEKYYEVRLFERFSHRLYLTPSGERLRTYAQHMLNLSEQARQDLIDLSHEGSVRIGASLTIGTYLLPGLISTFQVNFPHIEVFSRVDNTSVIGKLLLEDQLDLGLVEGHIISPHITEEFFSFDDLVFIASPKHPLAKPGKYTLHDLAEQSFLIREVGSGTQEIFAHAMQFAGIPWKTAGVYNNNEAIKQAVIANLGLAMLSKISIITEVQQRLIVPLDVDGVSLRRKFNLVFHRQKFFTRAMQLFWDSCKSIAELTRIP